MRLLGKIKSELFLIYNLFKNIRCVNHKSLFIFYVSRILRKSVCKLKIKPKALDGKEITIYIRPNSTDICAVIEVLCENVYLRHKEIVSSRYHRILDVGAHIGTFTVLAHHFFRPDVIIAVEPDEENIKILKLNLKENRVKEAIILNKAISSENGFVEFYIRRCDRGPIRTTILKDDVVKVMRVESITLDKLIKNFNINFIKIDCEGAEFPAILSSFLIKKVKTITMEYHRWGGDINELIRHLRNCGFKVVDIQNNGDMGIIYLVNSDIYNSDIYE